MTIKIKSIIKWAFNAAFKWDKYFRYSIFTRIVNFIYPKIIHTEYWKSFLDNKDFLTYFDKFEWKNFNSIDRKYTLLQFLKLIKNLNWDTVECWVFKWATSYLILKNIDVSKTHHVFDSFEWLSNPDNEDWTYWEKNNLSCWIEVVKNNLSEFQNVKYYKWWIPDKFNEVNNLLFSFVHIDVDLYKPTKDSLDFFYTRLVKWWIIICDDYGFSTCPWAKKAMDEFAEFNNLEILDLTTWQWIIIKN